MPFEDDIRALQELLARDEPKTSDVVVWLQGDRYDRAPKVLEMFERVIAPLIVVTGNNVLVGEGPRPGEINCTIEEMVRWLTDRGVPMASILVDSQSMNTPEQARYVLQEAIRRGWKRIIVVGEWYNQPRIFLTFLRQAHLLRWRGTIFNQIVSFPGPDDMPSGREQTSRELRAEEMIKIRAYERDVADPAEGIAELKKRI